MTTYPNAMVFPEFRSYYLVDRRYRKQHSLKHGNDLSRICKALRERQAMSKRKVVTRSPRLRCSPIEK